MVFVDIAFIDLADLPQINALFAELFPGGRRPARTVYQAARLPYDARIKVAGTAVSLAMKRMMVARLARADARQKTGSITPAACCAFWPRQ